MTETTYNITETQVSSFKIPDYDNGLQVEQNGTFSRNWIFNNSEYNKVISEFINVTGINQEELDSNGINSASSLEELRALQESLLLDDINVVEFDEIIDVDEIDDIELELFYELDETEKININEFSELLKKSGINLDSENVTKIFVILDKDSNGVLDSTEVMRFVNYFREKKVNQKRNKISQENTIKKISVNIDTRFRDDYYKTTSSAFDYEIPDVQKNVVNMKIGSLEVPMTNYTISSKLKNNKFLIISDSNTRIEEYDVSSSWRFHTQIGDISADYQYGTIRENTSITVTDISQAGVPGFLNGHGPSYSSTHEYNPGIIPIKKVTFETMDPPNGINPNDISTNYNPVKVLRINRETNLPSARDVPIGDLAYSRTRNGDIQYMGISTDTSFAHPETGDLQLYQEGEVPGTTTTETNTEVSNYTKIITTTNTIKKYYNFIRLRWCRWKEGVWNAYDGQYTNDQNQNKRYVIYSETKNDNPDRGGNLKKINVYSPRGNPRRTDVDFNNLTYVTGNAILPPYDCSMMHELTRETRKKKQIHLKALRFMRLEDNKEIHNFSPVKSAWLVTLPDGNYDEAFNNQEARFERIVNDAINVAIPGALDNFGNFAAIINPQDYDFINPNDTSKRNSVFMDENVRTHNISKCEPEFSFTIDRISKRSVFATPQFTYRDSSRKNVNVVSRITKVNKFTVREGQSGLRTTFGGPGDWSPHNYLHPRQGEPYPEMMALLSKSREPKIVTTPIKSNPKSIQTIKFNIDSYGNEDNVTNIQYKLGWMLGFRTAQYEVSQSQHDKTNLENAINDALENSEIAREQITSARRAILIELMPGALENLEAAESAGTVDVDLVNAIKAHSQNNRDASQEYINYNNSARSYVNTSATSQPGGYDFGSGSENEYFQIRNIAGVAANTAYHTLVPINAITQSFIIQYDTTTGDVIELAQNAVTIAEAEIGLYRNVLILKEAHDEILSEINNGTLQNIVIVDDIDFKTRAAAAANPWLPPLSLTETQAIPSSINSSTPIYKFKSSLSGNITVDLNSQTDITITNPNQFPAEIISNQEFEIHFNITTDNTYSGILITVTDILDNDSDTLTIPDFTVSDIFAPSITIVTSIGTTNNQNPQCEFTTNEGGTLRISSTSYSNLSYTYNSTTHNSNSTPPAITSGNHIITFNNLPQNTYSDVTITITDAANNVGSVTIPSFTIT